MWDHGVWEAARTFSAVKRLRSVGGIGEMTEDRSRVTLVAPALLSNTPIKPKGPLEKKGVWEGRCKGPKVTGAERKAECVTCGQGLGVTGQHLQSRPLKPPSPLSCF